MRFPAFLFFCAAAPALADLLEGLPGVEVSTSPQTRMPAQPLRATPPDSVRGVNWFAPSVEEQLARDRTLYMLGKGCVFVPAYSEPRREPEVTVFNPAGARVAVEQTGRRILLDTGSYVLRFGSGISGNRLRVPIHVEEGRTTVPTLSWGGLLVETISDSGGYIDGQYDLIRMENWTSYGRGNSFKEERLQDVKVWILPPGLYRLSKTGEGYNSLRNYLTVQINPGELHSVELVFDRTTGGRLVSGGTKSLNSQTRVGRNWNYGLRVGGNFDLTRNVDEAALEQRTLLFSSDLRTRARYDVPLFFGVNEALLQNSFLKQFGMPLITNSDFLQLRTTWVRRLNPWLGPYVRGQVSTHVFPTRLELDTAYRVTTGNDTAGGKPATDTLNVRYGSFRSQPAIFPISLAEGMGVNLEWLSRYAVSLNTQLGLAARQQFSEGDYLARTSNSFEKAKSSSNLGAEGILVGTIRISTQFTLDLRMELFAENGRPDAAQLENLEADFRFFLSSHLEIGYLFQMNQILDQVANRFPSRQSLSMRLSFNY